MFSPCPRCGADLIPQSNDDAQWLRCELCWYLELIRLYDTEEDQAHV